MTTLGKELREIIRDGRIVAAAAIVFVLLSVAIASSARRVAEEKQRRADARLAEERVWSGQGERNPHIAAHFGKYALKPLPTLAVFDPGVLTYSGSAVWIEAHYQNPFTFRPSDDATSLLRFGELAPSTIVQWLLPLLVIGIGFPMVAQERERGTLRQVLSLGIDGRRLIAAKTAALAIAIVALVLAATAVGALFAAGSPGSLTTDHAIRAAGVAVVYAAHLAIFVALTIVVSARARTAPGAVTILLAFWIGTTLIVPRIAAEVAAHVHPVPSNAEFWAGVRRDIDHGIDGHNPRNARRKALEARLLAQYRVSKVEDLPINFEGLALEEGERYANQVFDDHYGRLFETFRRRDALQQAFGIVSPFIAVRGISMALSGTDVAHHVHFARSAEKYRRELQTYLNADLTVNARNVAFLDYKRGRALWDAAPKFAYEPPPAMQAMQQQNRSLLLLGVWLLTSGVLLALAARALDAGEPRPRRVARPAAHAEVTA